MAVRSVRHTKSLTGHICMFMVSELLLEFSPGSIKHHKQACEEPSGGLRRGHLGSDST